MRFRKLHHIDLLLLGTLLPLWLFCLTLHIQEIKRTGFGGLPIYAAAAEKHGGYPVVAGFRLERGRGGQSFELGDRLIRVRSTDLAGVGYIGFDALALDAMAGEKSAPALIERNGHRQIMTLEMQGTGVAWYRALPLVVWALVAILVLLRGPPVYPTRLFFAATFCVVITGTQFHGGPPWQTYTSLNLFNVFGGIGMILALRWAIGFPDEIPNDRRLSVSWSWLGVIWWLARSGYYLGGPLLASRTAVIALLFDGLFAVGGVVILTRNYFYADPVGKRRVKWVVLTAYAGVGPLLLLGLARVLWPDPRQLDDFFEPVTMLFVLVPIGFLIAILRYNLYDIDRLISQTAIYSALGGVLLAATLTVIPNLAAAGSNLLGIEPATSQTLLSVTLAGLAVPAQRRFLPQFERLFFRERHDMETDIARLLHSLSEAPSPESLAECAGQELDRILSPESTVMYARSTAGETYEPVFVRGHITPPAFDSTSALVANLSAREGPLASSLAVGNHAAIQLGPFDVACLETLGVPLVLPVRHGSDLIGFLTLGPKRSGDVYTSTDIALLTAVSDKLSSEFLRFDQAAAIESAQTMRDALRRYVPGSVAEQIEAGQKIESDEREVTVLFVDLCSYTQYAENRAPQEVFSTVNQYTETISTIVSCRGGSVVEFNGDGMMVVFGAPTSMVNKERAAVHSALEIVDAMRTLPALSTTGLMVGVGIATGRAFVGNIRAADRMIWSAIGDTTNLSSRLQQMSRELEASIVIDSATAQSTDDLVLDWRVHPGTRIRGRHKAADLFSLPL
jgi:class 3 adenylate cyclase